MVVAFNRMIDSLETLEAERRATAASISHELRTPLTVLQARLHAICDGVIAADDTELNTLLFQVEHLGRLVGDLHTLSMADAGQLSLPKAAPGPGPNSWPRRWTTCTPSSCSMACSWRCTCPRPVTSAWPTSVPTPTACARSSPTSSATPSAMRPAAHGLGVALTVESDIEGRAWAVLRISDAGPGLPSELRSHPFQRFAQVPGKRRREGSGLGLSIVKALTVSQGGSVEADESEQGGARFTLRFPRV